jgi:hypothetical protein
MNVRQYAAYSPSCGGCTRNSLHIFLLALNSPRKDFFACALRWQSQYESALESGHDEQAAANSHNIFQCGDHQVGNFEGFH